MDRERCKSICACKKISQSQSFLAVLGKKAKSELFRPVVFLRGSLSFSPCMEALSLAHLQN